MEDSKPSVQSPVVQGNEPDSETLSEKITTTETMTGVKSRTAAPSPDNSNRALVRWTKAMAICTAALVIAAILQFWAMRGQLREMTATRESGDMSTAAQLAVMQRQADAMRQQIEEMKVAAAQTERAVTATNRLAEEAAKTAVASQTMADAATEANRLNKDATAEVQRAVVGIQELRISGPEDVFVIGTASTSGDKHPPGPFREWVVSLVWQNSGNSLARDIKFRGNCFDRMPWVLDPGETPGPQVNGDASDTELRTSLQSKQTLEMGGCRLRTPGPKSRLSSLFLTTIRGRVTYRDAFTPAVLHVTDVCYEFWPILMQRLSSYREQDIRGAIRPCGPHNCVDDGCDAKTLDDAKNDVPFRTCEKRDGLDLLPADCHQPDAVSQDTGSP